MESRISRSLISRAEPWMALALCAAVAVAGAIEYVVHNQLAYAERFAPDWLPFAAAGLAAAGIMRLNGHPLWLRFQGVLRWSGLLVMMWAANGLPLDLLRLVPGLMPSGVDWPGLVTRTFKDVLMTGDGKAVKLGKDVSGVTVTGKLVETKKGEKVTVFKKRRRNTYRRKIGHRQAESHVKITAIGGKEKE